MQTITKDSTLILEGCGDIVVDGVEVGTYNGGLVMTWAENTVYIESDHHRGRIRAVKMGAVTVAFTTELEQGNLENIAMAYAIPTSSVLSGASSKILNLTPVDETLEHQMVFTSMSSTNNDLARTVTLNKVVRVGSTGTTYYRGTKQVYPVTFEALINSSGTFGSIVDVTAS